MQSADQKCLVRDCPERATFDYPLCKPHWRRWEKAEGLDRVEECVLCHWFVDEWNLDEDNRDSNITNEIINALSSEPPGMAPLEWEEAFDRHRDDVRRLGYVCEQCTLRTFLQSSRRPHGPLPDGVTRVASVIGGQEAPPAHRPRLAQWYIYVLELNDGEFYIGYTGDLKRRVEEHKSVRGGAKNARGKEPRLVYFEEYEGGLDFVKSREAYLTKLNLSYSRRRQLREMIEEFQKPLRLLDLS